MTTYLSYRTQKITYKNLSDLQNQINNLNASKIISIKPCIPTYTSTTIDSTVEIFFEYYTSRGEI